MSDIIPPGFDRETRSATPLVPAAAPGQGTMIEQARAIADVRAAIMIAREDPRIEADCVAEMRRACSMKEMAEVAFFRVKRGKDDGGGDNMVTGPTIDLANELSRCWRNINSGHKELARDEQSGQSEVLAYAWDIEKNNRREQTIIVPHKRGKYRVYDTQGIREVIAGVAARVEREMIFRVLPTWFRIQAVELCQETLATGDGRPLEQRIADCKAAFYGIDIMADALERKIGRPAARWTPEDIAVLTVVFKSIRRGQSDAADEFPAVTARPQPDNVRTLEAALASGGTVPVEPARSDSGSVPRPSEPSREAPGTQEGGGGVPETLPPSGPTHETARLPGAGEASQDPPITWAGRAQEGGGAAGTPPPSATTTQTAAGDGSHAPDPAASGVEGGGAVADAPPPAPTSPHYDPLRGRQWPGFQAWALECRLLVERIPTTDDCHGLIGDPDFDRIYQMAHKNPKATRIAAEVLDAIQDRITLLGQLPAQGGA